MPALNVNSTVGAILAAIDPLLDTSMGQGVSGGVSIDAGGYGQIDDPSPIPGVNITDVKADIRDGFRLAFAALLHELDAEGWGGGGGGGGGGEANTASSAGLNGVGLTLTKTGVNLPFKNLAAANSYVSITDDAVNKTVDIGVNVGTTAGTVAAGDDARFSALGLADGDYGDFTVASLIATIVDRAVTYSNIQKVSATDRILGRKSPDTISFVAAGGASSTNDGTPTPTLPANILAGDVMFMLIAARGNTQGWTATGWEEAFSLLHPTVNQSSLTLLWRAWQSGDVAPTLVKTGGGANETNHAQIAVFRGVHPTDPFSSIGDGSTSSVSEANIGPIGGVAVLTGGAALVMGHRADDWTSVATLSGDLTWVEIGEPDDTGGDDGGMVWDYGLASSATLLSSQTFSVTGGVAATWTGIMAALRPISDEAPGGTIEEIICTPFARSLLDDTTAAEARTTLDVYSISQVDSLISSVSSTAAADLAAHVAAADPHIGYVRESTANIANGYAALDSDACVLFANVPRIPADTLYGRKAVGTGAPTYVDVGIAGADRGVKINASVQLVRSALTGGDVTASEGSNVLTIGANRVSLAMMAQVTDLSFLGKSTAGAGNVEQMSAATALTAIGGANIFLSNLGVTSINSDLDPGTANARDFGSIDARWRDMFLNNINASGTITAGSSNFSSTTATFGNVTVGNINSTGTISVDNTYGIDAVGVGLFNSLSMEGGGTWSAANDITCDDVNCDVLDANSLLVGTSGSWSATNVITAGSLAIGSGSWSTGNDISCSDIVAVTCDVSGSYFVDGLKVVTSRGALITDADGTLASATSRINAILARLRVTGGHGLIAD